MTQPKNSKEADGPRSELSSPSPNTFAKASPLRNSAASRSRSLSPRKKAANQPIHIRMNLTETQMDKITDAFSEKVNGSPSRRVKTDAHPRCTVPDLENTLPIPNTPGLPNSDHGELAVMSPTFSELMPVYHDDSLVKRRQKSPLPPLEVSNTPKSGSKPRRSPMEYVDTEVSPLSSKRQSDPRSGSRPASSNYSMSSAQLQPPRPLNLRHNRISRQKTDTNDTVIDIYNNWATIYSSGNSPEQSPSKYTASQYPRRSKSNVEGLRRQTFMGKTPPVPELAREAYGPPTAGLESPLFSPLAMYFRGQDFPTIKKGEKTLIGDNGWLERTGQQIEKLDKDKKTPQRKPGLLDSIKKIAKDMTELHHPGRRSADQPKISSGVHFAISLSAREQSLLYCELEYHLASALNDYISCELDKGHLVPDSFKKIADAWYHQGRPRVVGFRFDLETQIDLVSLHTNEFTFYGRRQCNPVEISSLLQTMKVNARAMRIRTFCQPDSVIAKQLVDAQSLFDMIGVTKGAQVALAEIVQFFKVIVEREQDFRKQRQSESDRVSQAANQQHERL